MASGVATTDAEYAEAVVDILSANPGFGIWIRAHPNLAGAARGYMAYFTAGTVKILRMDNSLTFTAVGSASACALPVANGYVLRITATGVGSQVQLDVTCNSVSVLAGIIDNTASRITTLGSTAVYFDDIGSDTQYAHISSIALVDTVSSSTMAITGPLAGKIAPLSAGTTGTASFSLVGTYSGAAPNQWRLVLDGGSTSVTGFDWQAFSSAPSAGAFAQTVASVPKLNGWYNLQVRDSAVPGDIYTSGKVGAGVLVGVDGQSNAWLWFSTSSYAGDSSLTPNALVRITGKQPADVWSVPATATMNAAIACANALATTLQCPVGLVDGSWDASGLTFGGASGASGPGGQWVPTATNAYGSSLSAINAAGGKLIGNIWIQGEGDAGAGVSQATYYAALGTMIAQRRTDLGQASLPYIMVTLARNGAGMADASIEAIRKAQVQKCADANIYRVDRMDLPLHTDGVHHSAAGFITLGQRCAQAILAANGEAAQYRGPSFASVSQISAAVFDVNLTHHSGTDFTPTSAITGFRVTDPGASNAVIAVSTAVRQTAGKIRLTLASAPVAMPDVSYLYGAAPTITGVVKDNSTLTLPLEYNSGVTATALPATATSVTITLENRSGALRTSLTGLKWAFFDQATPDLLSAPIVKGAVETTDASGVLVLDITGSALAPGGIGWLIVSNSDGTTSQLSSAFAGPVAVA